MTQSAPKPAQAPVKQKRSLSASGSSDLLKRMARDYLKPHTWPTVHAMVWMAVAALMTGAMAQLMEPIIDKIFAAKEPNQALLWTVAGASLAAFTLRGIAYYLQSVIMNRVGQQIVSGIQTDLIRHLTRADLAFFHEHPSGTLIARMISDVNLMRGAVTEGLTGIGRSGLTLICLIGVMFWQDWRLSIAAFVVFPAAAWMVAKLGRRLRRLTGTTQEETGRFTALLNQMFQGIRQVKANGMEEFETRRLSDVIDNLVHLLNKGFRLQSLSIPIGDFLSGIAIVAVMVYGGHRVMTGEATAGSLFAFITAFLLAYEPMKKLAKLNATLQMGLAAAERVYDLLGVEPAIRDRADATVLAAKDAAIKLENVSFGYAGVERTALTGITLSVPAGRTVALVGASGAGKSTILNLIPRFYDVTGGRILVNGTDLRELTLGSLRDHIALVSQEVAVFDDTIANNIAYGRPGASRAEIEMAAESAAAHGFISALPQGYETRIGEMGVKLSGGQRQRIAIARAMLRNAPILLLDEATSALDAESERLVQDALRRLSAGRTTLVVAHRLSTVIDADEIVVMDHGRIVEQGRHAELITRDGPYRRLYGSQGGEPPGIAA